MRIKFSYITKQVVKHSSQRDSRNENDGMRAPITEKEKISLGRTCWMDLKTDGTVWTSDCGLDTATLVRIKYKSNNFFESSRFNNLAYGRISDSPVPPHAANKGRYIAAEKPINALILTQTLTTFFGRTDVFNTHRSDILRSELWHLGHRYREGR